MLVPVGKLQAVPDNVVDNSGADRKSAAPEIAAPVAKLVSDPYCNS